MNSYSVILENLVKYFGRRLVFNGIDRRFDSGNIYGVAGPNGSGKSTIVKIIANLISPTKGKVIHLHGDKKINYEHLHNYIGFVSPYLFLYDEFTARENLLYFSKIRGIDYDEEYANFLLSELNIYKRKDDVIRGYSSGMKQRLKFIFALIHNPSLVILDEPTSNLDTPGKEKVYEIIDKNRNDKLFIIASNEESDLSLCGEIINLENFKNNGI
ncbi:ABC transporter-like protein [Melioribacter roseus P3M-2]|uniref:ABC transporter-like protein n=1 Tax=Melioribacter roseus (strain DSM 23840 / JCM 17771 / VKM B-2668 / P3M-2) TaxID=1191523 RepID=I7A0U4_MELRP|nr:ABC transporter ATP-binding protein [Melioribacter roseus]AFN74858.1 ABC transporter-like protein [Melioribacter roseus P3M-2]